jgi:integrase
MPSGKSVRISATGDTIAKCRTAFDKKRREAEAADARGEVVVPKGQKAFVTFAREWLEAYPAAVGNRSSTITEKRYHVEARILPHFEALAAARGGAPYTLAEITPRVVDGFLSHLASAPTLRVRADAPEGAPVRRLSAKTAQNVSQTLRRMLATAARWGEMETAPEVPRPKAPKAEFDYLRFDEADRFLEAATDDEDRALLLTALRGGLRAGELLGLQWSRVDLTRREIRVDQQLGKRTKTEAAQICAPKAGSRTVPMSAQLADALRAIKHLRGPFVFCDEAGRPFNRDWLKRAVARAAKRAEIKRHIHPHTLRHTFASHATMRGVSLHQIQKWLGHSSIVMTMRYAHLDDRYGNALADLLDAPAAAKAS